MHVDLCRCCFAMSKIIIKRFSEQWITSFLTLCMLGNFSWFSGCLLTFFKINVLKNSFRNTIRVSNSFDPDQDRHSVGPDLGPNCLQRLLADDKCHVK